MVTVKRKRRNASPGSTQAFDMIHGPGEAGPFHFLTAWRASREPEQVLCRAGYVVRRCALIGPWKSREKAPRVSLFNSLRRKPGIIRFSPRSVRRIARPGYQIQI